LLGTINGSVLSVAAAIGQYNAAKSAAEAAAATAKAEAVIPTIIQRQSVAAMSASQLLSAYKTASGTTDNTTAIKELRAEVGTINSANIKSYLKSAYPNQFYANGGAFTNGIVSDPTAFNIGMMGEAGSEAIMPLTSINGRLGVSTNNSEMVQQLEIISDKISRLEAASVATAQHTSKVAKIMDRADNGDSINVTVVTE
jgi:hypothetical protein